MGKTVTINSRIAEPLKRHGGQVLERNGVSTTQAICRLYEYLEREQRVPDWMLNGAESEHEKRRAAVRRLAVNGIVPKDIDGRGEYRAHLREKHLAGERL